MSFYNISAPSLPLVAAPSSTEFLTNNLGLTAASILAFAIFAWRYGKTESQTVKVPVPGPTGWLSSIFGAVQFFKNAEQMLEEGYTKFNGATFKVPDLMRGRWLVIVNKPELIDEVRRAPDDTLSFIEATNDSLAVPWTLGAEVSTLPYHIPVIRTQLTRNLGLLFDSVRDEIVTSFNELIPAKEDEWLTLPALPTIMQIVCRTSNRIFVGLPLCRDPDYMQLNVQFTIDVVKGGRIISMFPDFIKPIIGHIFTSVPASLRRGMKHLQPEIERRQKMYDEYGQDWPDKPVDILTWLMDDAPPEERTIKGYTRRILTVNFAAIHTSSMSFTQALFNLASRPEYQAPLREEIEHVIREEGWTKAALQKMFKADSFLKECQRVNGLSSLSMNRKVLKPYTLSDGTHLPVGSMVACNSSAAHFNEETYEKADEFDGFRFANKIVTENEDGTETLNLRRQMVATSHEYLPFGHGRHACPGRFFAAQELKAMLAHVVLNYDVKMENEGVRPADNKFGAEVVPNPTAQVMFRRRKGLAAELQ